MTHPIPRPRPSSDPLFRPLPPPLPRRRSPVGPFCPSCAHPSCRTLRAQHLPLIGGHRSEYRREHTLAAAFQTEHSHLVVWFGEATGSYWAASSTGLAEVLDLRTLTRVLEPMMAHR
ncbi:hypothetical protein PWG71_19245 [Nocardiopsis sp. N85]|uniref:hypothetical protein n=1 Tax=Nocardiopsis sp. N85 TaxID=3029400 RepID=UPI00237F123A|nr:hypothetical protein [Nocardiopsis sp. N85]MDE3723531.1 hypothetical protein [Nocardiopsis sp. N85]